MKYCKLGDHNLDESAFGKHKSRKDGLQDHCLECRRATRTDKARPGYMQAYYLKNKEQLDAANKRRYEESDKHQIYLDNKERVREWDSSHPEKRAEYWQAFRVNHPEKYITHNVVSGKRLHKATPKWVDKNQIRQIYEGRPEGFHVDHIVPLKGKNVCGLHVPWNLQYLPAIENRKKSNKVKEL